MYRIVLLFFIVVNGLAAQTQNDDISKTVASALESNLNRIPPGRETQFEFGSRSDFKNCTAGTPIQVATFDASRALVLLNEWRVPILLDGQWKLFFTVRKVGSEYEVADLGGVGLAKEIQSMGSSSQPVHFLLRLFEAHADFVSTAAVLTPSSAKTIRPLLSAKSYMTGKHKVAADLLSLEEVHQLIAN